MSIGLDFGTPGDLVSESLHGKKITIAKTKDLKQIQLLHASALFSIPLIGTVVALVLAWQQGITAWEIALLLVMYALNVVGITVGFHRYFTHCAFETSTPMRVILAVLGSMACEGPLTYWVSNHRRHHQFSDRPGDPHSPYFKEDRPLTKWAGLWHAHIGWTFDHEITNTFLFAKDLLRDPVIAKVNQMYYFWVLLGLAMPILAGVLVTGSWMGAVSGFLWGGCVRLCLMYHFTNSINSITHTFGTRPFDTKEESRNNLWIAIPTGGEAWHNNHHAFPNSAKFGLKWWQIDLGFWTIWVLAKLGLIWDVKQPTPLAIAAKLSGK
jgi:stearoyl-CoA desaturase (Delta-9 desaturase)